MIEQVKDLGTKLSLHRLSYPEVLEDRKIRLEEAWPAQAAAFRISKLTIRRFGPWCARSNPTLKPLILVLVIYVRIPYQVRSTRSGINRTVCARHCRCKRKTTLPRRGGV